MGIALRVGHRSWEIGTPSFLKCFFSTVSVRLEAGRWGSQFPMVMTALHSGRLEDPQAKSAIEEVRSIREGLAAYPPSKVVWDFQSPDARPPWGDNIAPHITTLANYFWTSQGENLFDVLLAALNESDRCQQPVVIC